MKTIKSFSTALTAGAILFLPSGVSLADEQWWQFRGPEGNGHSDSTGLPLKWDEKNIVWRTPIHDRGWSSPVIWGDQIWLTTATTEGHKLFAVCVDRNSGRIIHDLHLFDVESPMMITLDNTYATPTPVIEPGRVSEACSASFRSSSSTLRFRSASHSFPRTSSTLLPMKA